MTPARRATFFVLLGLLLVVNLTAGVGGVAPSTSSVRSVTYVYEKDDGGVPSGVQAALNKLNRDGVLATAFEDDATDGGGDVPEQYKAPLEHARREGLPAIVVLYSSGAVRIVKRPTTEASVLEVVK